MSKKPMLQLALDVFSTREAIKKIREVEDYIDVIEIGTILLNSVGKDVIGILREIFPNKLIVADGKIADAGKVFGKMLFDQGANYVTAICAAETPTILELDKTGKLINKNNQAQIELTSHYSWDQVQEWKNNGIKQLVYHRSRDSQAAGKKWNETDLQQIKKLIDLGFELSITGGIEIEDISFFKELPIYIFIVGRTIREDSRPNIKAKNFKDEIAKYW
ncbi:MAG: 3-dehydro-L-gulonate-6-phosphate decarboxylase [Mycoplasma sp.]|nr:3-dehydro-L-gulonate-6-phosphate decarboxylase [Mycoplasma sp.]